MKKTILLTTATIMLLASVASAEKWNVDATHSSVSFEVSHMVISKAQGRFTDFGGVINFEGEDIANGSVEFTIQTASVDTDDESRDGHLRSEDFFEAEKFPTISFKSTKISEVKNGKFKLTGNFTMKDVTKEVTFDCVFRGVMKGKRGSKSGFSASATINRQDFNVSFSKLLDGGGLAVGNDVDLKIEIEANQAKEETKEEGKKEEKSEGKK